MQAFTQASSLRSWLMRHMMPVSPGVTHGEAAWAVPRDPAKSLSEAVACGAAEAADGSGIFAGGGRGPGGTMEVLTLTVACPGGPPPPPVTSSPMSAAECSQYLLDLLAQVPDPRKKRGRRHPLAGLLAVGIAAVIAGARSFAAIGQWAADAGPEVLAVLGAARGPAEESTFRRAFALVSADVLDRVLGAWLHTRAMRAGGRLVIAIDGKTVRGAKDKDG